MLVGFCFCREALPNFLECYFKSVVSFWGKRKMQMLWNTMKSGNFKLGETFRENYFFSTEN